MAATREEMTKKYLPKDKVMNILARIPVKSIIRFKCVCKSWYALIANPQFITQQLTQSSSSHKTPHSILLFNYRTLEISWLSNENFRVSESVSMPLLDSPVSDSHVCSPCDGILCLYHGPDKIALWNPSTREFRPLSSSGLVAPQNASSISSPDLGFGFDPKTNDYKVVRILLYQYMNRPLFGYQVEVYTLSTDSWRKIDTMVTATIWHFPRLSTYVKGFYYWRAIDKNQKCVILSFDMSNEVFQNIVLPPTKDKGEVSALDGLLELNGSIAAIYRTCDLRGLLTIWVMNRNENKWIKHFTVELQFPIRRVFAFCKNKDFLMEAINCNNGGELVSYSPRTGEIGHHGFNEYIYSLEVVICKESLVPLSREERR